MSLYQLNDNNLAFPPVNLALTEPNGLLAVGGDLQPKRLINAYSHGIFPWFGDSFHVTSLDYAKKFIVTAEMEAHLAKQ